MIVPLWQAGFAQGVTGDFGKAQKQAVLVVRGTGAKSAVVEQARFIDAITSLSSGYQTLQGPYWVARRHLGGQVSWELSWPAPELTAA